MHNTELRVTGMTCEHCVASVTEELSELESVSSIDVQLKSGGESIVTVQSTDPLTQDDLRAAVEEAGYALVAASE
jgi:copper chaperone